MVLATREDPRGGDAFFQKRVPKGAPEYVETARIEFPSGRTADEVCPTEIAVVAWCAQMGTITFHPWPVRSDDVDHPDELRLDLDPQPGTDFDDAVRVAATARELLADLGYAAFPKTSGGRGIHIYVRIEPRWTFTDMRHAAIAFGRELERRLPGEVTTKWWKEERGERIFVDYNQNARDRTIASAYSIRPKPGAPVSAPFAWDELDQSQARGLHGRDDARAVRRGGRPARGDRRRAPLPPAAARPVRAGGGGRHAVSARLPEDAGRAQARAAVARHRSQEGIGPIQTTLTRMCQGCGMRIDELLLNAEEPTFSFEFFPPRSEAGEANLAAALTELHALAPAFVSVTYGAGGSTRDRTVEIVSELKRRYGLEAMAHLTCVNATVSELRSTLDVMRGAGVENVLALRGDPPRGQDRWTKTDGGLGYSRDLIELLQTDYPFAIGAAAFPETHIHATSPEDDLRFLKAKVDAGASFLITQMFFDNAYYFDFVARARDIGIDVPIIPGVMPILSTAGIKRMAELSAAKLPSRLEMELAVRLDDDEAVAELGVSYATLQCVELLERGAPGIHFITLNRSSATRAILSALRVARPWDRVKSPL